MLSMLKGWEGKVQVNGTIYDNIDAFICENKAISGEIHILLCSGLNTRLNERAGGQKQGDTKEYKITVKQYMTKPAEPGFDFMAKWNNDNPMPLRTMIGHIIKETRGMYQMELHGDIYAEKICTCMKCGKRLTNPVSQFFGIGPECGGHGYVSPFDTEEELHAAVASYRKQLQAITWTGWVIKSAITEMEEVEND